MIGAGALGMFAALFGVTSLAAQSSQAVNPPPGQLTPQTEGQVSNLDDTLEAGEAGGEEPARKLIHWNEFDGKYLTLRVGGGFLIEYDAYAQDDDSKRQFAMYPDEKVRDARVLLKGHLKFIKSRKVTYSVGIMYDGANDEWVARQTGLMIEMPEIMGHLFIGRTKEGFSLNKVMVGYAGWTMERFTMNDATIPILADGIKWFGHSKKRHLNWNLGIYKDWISQSQAFSTYDHQVVGRFAWVPEMSEDTILHLGLGLRYGVPKDNKIQLRSRPETNPAPYFIDTGKFSARDTRMLGSEIYYRPGSLLVGSEYFFQKVNAPESGDPLFHGGDVFVSWLATGEVRSYNTAGGYFNGISPKRSIYDGGIGAWELVARFSFSDLDAGTLRGGKFWRFTPMVNWHLSDNIRLEMVYGVGTLDRFEIQGRTQFFQTRLQLQL
jgi:phosphate-selective porin OprO/OprP